MSEREPDPFMEELDAEESGRPIINNVTGSGVCEICANEGWVEIDGHTIDHDVTYEKGCAPCSYCEIGEHIARCLTTGTNTWFGSQKHKPQTQPWRIVDNLRTSYALNELTHASQIRPATLTLGEYLDSPEGKHDPYAEDARAILAETIRSGGKRGRRRMGREDTPAPVGSPLLRAGSRFARLAERTGKVEPSPTERSGDE